MQINKLNTPTFEQVVPHELQNAAVGAGSALDSPSKLKKSLMVARDEGRMQAYGWSLPSSKTSSLLTSSSAGSGTAPQPTPAAPQNQLNMTIPVPVYCRPLFEQDNDLKLSCASTLNLAMDASLASNFGDLVRSSAYFSFVSSSTSTSEFKSSCIWIANLNSNDTHVCILDANRPSDLIDQFTLKDVKVYCVASVAGADRAEYPLSDEKLKSMRINLQESNARLNTDAGQAAVNDSTLDDINYIEEHDTSAGAAAANAADRQPTVSSG